MSLMGEGLKNNQKCPNFNFGLLKTKGVGLFQTCLNDKLPSPAFLKKKIKRLNFPILNVNMPKYAFQDVCLWGSSAVNMFSNTFSRW